MFTRRCCVNKDFSFKKQTFHRLRRSLTSALSTEVLVIHCISPVSFLNLLQIVCETFEEVREFCIALNNTAISNIADFKHLNPHVLTLRNEARASLNHQLLMMRASHLQQRLYMWRSEDSNFDSPSEKEVASEFLPTIPCEKTGKIPTYGFFFVGMEYVFSSTTNPQVHWVNNNKAVAHGIILDPREPPDDLTKPIRQLRYPPIAIIAKPSGPAMGRLYENPCIPEGCILVAPTTFGSKITIKLPTPTLAQTHGQTITKVSFKRKGFPLSPAYCVTDYWAQGVSFKDDCWICHLAPPPDGFFQRASLFVALTRYGKWSHVKTLTPLWPADADDATISAVVKRQVISHVTSIFLFVCQQDGSSTCLPVSRISTTSSVSNLQSMCASDSPLTSTFHRHSIAFLISRRFGIAGSMTSRLCRQTWRRRSSF